MKHITTRIGICLLTAICANVYGSPLFKTKKGTTDTSSLSPSLQQRNFDIEKHTYENKLKLAEEALLTLHFETLAKKNSKKTAAELRTDALNSKKPTEKELKAAYVKFKAQIPPNYTYEQVKPELTRIVSGQGQEKKRQTLLTTVKKQYGFSFSLSKPKAPVVKINTHKAPTKGKTGAKIQLVEFADYNCGHCKHAYPEIKKLVKEYGKKIEFVFMDFPLGRNDLSRKVAEGGYCALQQGKYWEFHDKAFNKKINATSSKTIATNLKLDMKKFEACQKSAAAKSFVNQSFEEGERIGISGTPSIYLNGRRLTVRPTYADLKKEIDAAL